MACSLDVKGFTTAAQLTQSLSTANLSPAVIQALIATNEALEAHAPPAWKEFAAQIAPYLYSGSDLVGAMAKTVERLESQPGLGAHLLKNVKDKTGEGVHQGALVDIGAGLVCVAFSSLRENTEYVDRYVDSSTALLYAESDRQEWNAVFDRLASQITHHR
jgi:hypothetical protein